MLINGWALFAHPEFLHQLAALLAQVQEDRRRRPDAWKSRNAYKRLAAVARLAFQAIPSDPAGEQWMLGNTLGKAHRHWRRAKFFQQYRLFFRFDATARLVVLAWVNDEDSLRAYGRADDAYAVFRAGLAKGRPPDDWTSLREDACDADALWGDLKQQLDELLGE